MTMQMLTFHGYFTFTCRVEVDMYGWFGNSDIRNSNGELPSHGVPPPVEYITYEEYLAQHQNIDQNDELRNLTFNVTLVTSLPSPPTVSPPPPEPYCIDYRIFYGIAALAGFFLAMFVIVLIILLCKYCRRNDQPR